MELKPYADTPGLRVRQQLQDAVAVLWIAGWAFAGRALYRTIEALRAATAQAEEAGAGFAGRLDAAARTAGDLPVVGGTLRRPFAGAADAGRALESAGAAAGDTVHTLALWLGLLVALLPIAWVLARYVPGRIRWMREAAAAAAMALDGEARRLLAIRAAATAPLHLVRRAGGDDDALARLELERLGLRLPPSVGSRS
jgi:hypothetical protein